MTPFVAEQKPTFEESLKDFKNDLHTLRTGRATTALVENILVDAYGSKMEIKALGNMTLTDARSIVIDPWDKSLMKEVEKALTEARLGTNPTVDGAVIRLSFPAPTEESRKQVVKMLKEKLQEAKIALRKVRETIRETVMANEKSGKFSEDERFRMQTELDEMTKEFTARLETMAVEKEKEIMTI